MYKLIKELNSARILDRDVWKTIERFEEVVVDLQVCFIDFNDNHRPVFGGFEEYWVDNG